jgi:ubiquinone/menaquinone biosynthesis C-methylase UbiE
MNEALAQQMAAQLRRPSGEAGVQTGEWMNRGNVHMNTDTLEILNAVANDTILEIGMGNGFFVKDILQKYPSVKYTGCDFSDVMVTEAQKLNAEWISKGQAKFICADVANMPFDDGSFNKIFTVNTIYFWEDATAILAELKRVLKKDGTLIISLRPKHLMQNYPFTKYGFTLFAKADVVLLLEANGFTIVQAVEKQEPDFELNGEIIKMECLVIAATCK